MHVSLFIPHYFNDGTASSAYGSTRQNNTLKRSLAFSRCLESLLSLERASLDYILNIKSKLLERSPTSAISPQLTISISVITNIADYLHEILSIYQSRISVIQCVDCDDPKYLPLIAMQKMLKTSESADIYGYLEDDLIISDPLFFDKLHSCSMSAGDSYVFMPHRFEKTVTNRPHKFFVDGIISTSSYHNDLDYEIENNEILFVNNLGDMPIDFVKASNPHSGCVFLSNLQRSTALKNLPPSPFMNI